MARPVTDKHLHLDSRFEEVARVEKMVLRAAKAHDYDETARFAVKLALEEALTNAIKHGNRFAPGKQVTVDFYVGPDEIRVTICDEGRGFSPDRVPDPTLDENLEKPHGRGIMLMRAYMSEVRFSDDGKCVTMIKRRGDQADG